MVYHAGALIENVVQPKLDTAHLHDDEISLYIVAKRSQCLEVLRVETHVFRCDACKERMVEATKTLHPARRGLGMIPRDL